MLKVLTLILWLDIINCIWIKFWFSISPWEDRGILDKKYISVHSGSFSLEQWFSKCGPQTEYQHRLCLLEMQVLGTYLRFPGSETLRVGPSSLFCERPGAAAAHSSFTYYYLPPWEVESGRHRTLPGFPTSRPTMPTPPLSVLRQAGSLGLCVDKWGSKREMQKDKMCTRREFGENLGIREAQNSWIFWGAEKFEESLTEWRRGVPFLSCTMPTVSLAFD